MSGLGRGYSRTRKYDNFKNYNYHKSESSRTFKEAAQEWEKRHPEEVVPALHKSDAAFVDRIDNINHSYLMFKVYFHRFGGIKKSSLEYINQFFIDNEKNFTGDFANKIINSIKLFSKYDAYNLNDKKVIEKRKKAIDSINANGSYNDFPVKTIGLVNFKYGFLKDSAEYYVVMNLGFLIGHIYKNVYTTNFANGLFRKQVILDFKSYLKESRLFKNANDFNFKKDDKTEYPKILLAKLMPKYYKYIDNPEFAKYGNVICNGESERLTTEMHLPNSWKFEDQHFMEQFEIDRVIKYIGSDRPKHVPHTISLFIKDYNFNKIAQELGRLNNEFPEIIIRYAKHWEIKIFNKKSKNYDQQWKDEVDDFEKRHSVKGEADY